MHWSLPKTVFPAFSDILFFNAISKCSMKSSANLSQSGCIVPSMSLSSENPEKSSAAWSECSLACTVRSFSIITLTAPCAIIPAFSHPYCMRVGLSNPIGVQIARIMLLSLSRVHPLYCVRPSVYQYRRCPRPFSNWYGIVG